MPWDGPILAIADQLQDTTVDAMIVGHTHRVSNLMVGDILVTEGINAGATYSVLQLMVEGGDVDWAGGATRVAKDIGVAPRADVKAIVDDANAKTAVLRNKVIGTQSDRHQARPRPGAPNRAMGDMVADAMREKYPGGVEAALHQLGRPPRRPRRHAAAVGRRAARRDHLGRDVHGPAVRQPDGDRDADRRPADRPRSRTASRPSATRRSTPAASRRSPASRSTSTATAPAAAVIDGIWKAPDGPSGPLTPLGPTDTVRFVTNDFMYTGGDGYTVFAQGTNVLQPGDDLLQVAIDYVTAHSPVANVVDGRIVGP